MALVKLFGTWYSPFSRRIEIALKIKGVEYEYIEEDLKNKSPLLLKYNPVHKKIPVLLHNGKPICESLVILQYIDETWEGPSILPNDPYEKATARFWAKFLDENCFQLMMKACRTSGEEQEKAKEEASEALQFLESSALQGKKFFGGDTVGMVDIVGNMVAYWLGILQELAGIEVLTREKFPKLSEWIDEFVNCSIIKGSLPPRDELIEFFQPRFQAATAPK